MNVMIIPSWYPSETGSMSGIFFLEQAEALARNCKDLNVGISTWGQNDERLLLWARSPISNIYKLFSKPPRSQKEFSDNLVEYFTPAFTWSRKIAKGNIKGIIEANESNLLQFQQKFGKVDILHAHVGFPGGFVAMKVSEKYKLPYVITEHMGPFPNTTFMQGKSLLNIVKEPFTKSYLNIAVSRPLQRKMKAFGIESVVIPNLVNKDYFVPNYHHHQTGPVEILSVGRLEEEKGHSFLLKSFLKIRHIYPDATLKIIGGGSLARQLYLQTKSLGLQEAVLWVGAQSREEVKMAMQRCSFFVLSSLRENLPLVLLEALACGKPIVVTTCDGPEDIVNQTNGLLAKVSDVEDLYLQMKSLIEHLSDYDSVAIRKDFENRYADTVITARLRKAYLDCLEID